VSRAVRRVLPGLLGLVAVLAAACASPAPDSKLPLRARLSCGELHEILSDMPFDTVRETTGKVADPHTAVSREGCRLVARGSRKRLSVLERTSATRPDLRIKELLPSRGWQEDTRYTENGPGHTSTAYTLGGVICYHAARWDVGGEQIDPNALPPDTYEITVSCAERAP